VSSCHRRQPSGSSRALARDSELRDPNPTTLAFLAACAELGMRRLGELNEPDNTGYAPAAVTQWRGLRHSAADAYLRPARRRRNLSPHQGVRRADFCSPGPCHRRGVPGCGRCDPESDRLP
jgi:choline dehydrogenase-like flavoprotein